MLDSANSLTEKQVLDRIRAVRHNHIKVAVTDIDGVLRGKYIHKEKFLAAAQSHFGFCNVVFGWDVGDVCYDNGDYTGWHTGYPDVQACIDLKTFREIPWEEKTPFFLADFYDEKNNEKKALSICPRNLLKRQIEKAKKLGFEAKFGIELEWFNFHETPQSLHEKSYTNMTTISPGMFGYSILRSSQNKDYFHALFGELLDFAIPLEGIHTETGPGVYEAAILASDALEAADRGVLLKNAIKEIAHRFGIMPSFMAKWDSNLPGCSGHIHQSLWDIEKRRNVFFDENRNYKMSQILSQYVAGQMHCLPEILPFFAPNVNSYKRLVEGLWAPTKVTWGVENRTTALRIIPGTEKSTRLETRVAGADMNPYLGIVACLASGLYGIQNQLSLQQEAPILANAYSVTKAPSLARNLWEATEKMERSQVAKELFGDDFVKHFVQTRQWEWRQFQKTVTNWEIKRYFEII